MPMKSNKKEPTVKIELARLRRWMWQLSRARHIVVEYDTNPLNMAHQAIYQMREEIELLYQELAAITALISDDP